ncbi:MAG: hypothetical protein LBS21_12950 [Clostridiales bacterium]|jgi:hypothetical protein|nr:hypothetical protein [Clostridiales bacterium]
MDIVIRNIDINSDIQGIREAHGADEQWGSDQACYFSAKTSLENGFFIQIAICNDRIAGHASITCWSNQLNSELITGILTIGRKLGYKYLSFCMLNEKISCFKPFRFETSDEHDIFMERYI